MSETDVVKFLFGWCKDGDAKHDECKVEKQLPEDRKVKSSKSFHYICTCEHHKGGKAPDKVEA